MEHIIRIPLTGKAAGKHMLVDAEDAHFFEGRPLWISTAGYACLGDGGKTRFAHRLLMGAKRGQVIDHINGDPLDNRRSNLRLCTQKQNVRNSRPRKGTESGLKGVRWQSSTQTWCAQIMVDGRREYLGHFSTAEEAAQVYDAAAVRLFGEFAHPNAPVTPFGKQYVTEWFGPRWKATSPEGEVFWVMSMGRFCASRGLCRRGMERISKGVNLRHRGWACERISRLPARNEELTNAPET